MVTQLCRKLVGDCDGTGECEDRPTACPEIFDPVCGCDDVSYDNELRHEKLASPFVSEGSAPDKGTRIAKSLEGVPITEIAGHRRSATMRSCGRRLFDTAW